LILLRLVLRRFDSLEDELEHPVEDHRCYMFIKLFTFHPSQIFESVFRGLSPVDGIDEATTPTRTTIANR
jgi:hypothetical protein